MSIQDNSPESAFLVALTAYANELYSTFHSFIPANPEDQLKRPVRELLESFFSGSITTKTETPVDGLGARPDIGVSVNGLLSGYVELKAPGKGANTNRFSGADGTQWKKYKALPNILYTDGLEWALYRDGKREGSLIQFEGDIIEDGETAISKNIAHQLYELLLNFLDWQPLVPDRPKALAEKLAPLCRLLREDVEAAASLEGSNIQLLFNDWKRLFFPDADNHRFADAYAQTLTYALLLARLSGAINMHPEDAATILDSGHGLLAQTLRLLGNNNARREIATAVDLLERVIQAVNPDRLIKNGDPWLYFYEDFLAEYDPKLRRDYGVYYTPMEVIGCQVRLCAQLLEEKFDKPLAYADDDVTFLDPAAGTAAYPLAAIQYGLEKVSSLYGEGMISSKATDMAHNFYAFEYMVGPYAVSHLRITELLRDAGASFPEDGIRVYLTDTLDDPEADPPRFAQFEREIAEEHERAQRVKRDTQILICMGNPPYDREQRTEDDNSDIRRKGGWIRFGPNSSNHTLTNGILRDFIEGAPGVHVKNLYNDYVYFWRWALWKLYENEHISGPGIISFITASSYLRGPGFVSMRRKLREAFDELWIIDLEGDNLGARKTENVFAIQTPVAIAMGVRYCEKHSEKPAKILYTKITGTRLEKLSRLKNVSNFEDLEWQKTFQDWEEPILPERSGDYYSWPLITDVFPWQYSGLEFKRTWPISETKELLTIRWNSFKGITDQEEKNRYLRSTQSRNINKSGVDLVTGETLGALNNNIPPTITRYSFRSFDRQWIYADERLCDRTRKPLWQVYSDKQLFLTSMLTGILGLGPGAVVCNSIPDRHHFRGSYSGKDIIPLWRDADAKTPNIAQGLLKILTAEYGKNITAEDLFSYAYGILASPAYTEMFSEELVIPGPRLPLTKDAALFKKVVGKGRYLIWLHTYGERFVPEDVSRDIPQGKARNTIAIPSSPEDYPEDFEYIEAERTIRVGKGQIAHVSLEVWNFSVSGLHVVKSWLDYRKKAGAGRRSSPLDDIRPERWTSQMTKELLELLWVLEYTIAEYPELEMLLSDIIESDCFTEKELPAPSEDERKPPEKAQPEAQTKLGL